MKSKITDFDKVKIKQDGTFELTGTEVTVKTTGNARSPHGKPGEYPVKLFDRLDEIVDKEPLFSHLVRKLIPVESTDCPSTATDGVNLFWSQDFLSSLPEDEQSAVLLHEVLHCAFLHLWRREDRDAMRWNIATDYVINLVVNKSFPLPPGTLLDTQYKNMSAEEVYDRLPVKDLKEQGWCDKSHWEDAQGKQKDKQQGVGNSLIKKLVDKMNKGKNAEEEAAKKRASLKSASKREEEWRNEFDKSFTQQYGTAPEYIKRIVSQRHYIPVIDWAELVSQILSEDITDYTFSTPDRRFLEAEFVLPELYSWDRVKDVVFAYDTSGSISNNDLQAYRKETVSIMAQFPNLTGWAAVCDADLHLFREFTQESAEIDFEGGGGTDFTPVFNEIEKRGLRPKALFYFTDTEGSFPRHDPGYMVFWLVHSYIGDNRTYSLPFGKVIKFMNRADLKHPMRRGW